mgnify:CR=1 FL=1|jgi:hypothetical protein
MPLRPEQLLRQLSGHALRPGRLHKFVKHTRTLHRSLGLGAPATEASPLAQAEAMTVQHLLRQMDRLNRHLDDYLRYSDKRYRALRHGTPLQSRDHAAPHFRRRRKRRTPR